MFTPAAATPPPIKPIATIQLPTPGKMLQSPIFPQVAQLPLQEPTTAGGYVQEATSTSPLALARSPETPLPIPGIICQTWYSPAITWEARQRANRSTPSRATLLPALLRMTTSRTPKPVLHRHQRRQKPYTPPSPTPTPSDTNPPSPTPTATALATASPTGAPSATPTATSTPRVTPTPRVAPTPRPRPTPVPCL